MNAPCFNPMQSAPACEFASAGPLVAAGSVLYLFTCPAKGAELKSHVEIRAVKNSGLVGDRWCRPAWMYWPRRIGLPLRSFKEKWLKQKQPLLKAWRNRTPVTDNQFSLISMGDLERGNAILASMGVAPYSPQEMRRCIVVAGDVDLNSLRGRTFRIGNVRMRWSQMCTPCGLPGKRCKRRPEEVVAFKKAFGDDDHCWAGIRGSILSTGTIRLGDKLELTA